MLPSLPSPNGACRRPNLSEERRFWDDGYELVAGLDEVGKGAWAGPLTVGAAILAVVRDASMG